MEAVGYVVTIGLLFLGLVTVAYAMGIAIWFIRNWWRNL